MVKGPKFLNPADRARKEARKKELKKNKKQRQQVRSAAIESKDPEKIIADLECLDKLEFDPNADKSSSSANELLLKDKRKRLHESWTRILSHYQKEDSEKYESLKKLENEYEKRHKETLKEFEAIRAAQEVNIEDVFLPPEPDDDEIPDDDPLLSEDLYITPLTPGFKPPGCPPGMPPDLANLAENVKSKKLFINDPPVLPQNIYNPTPKAPRPRRGPPKDRSSNSPKTWGTRERQEGTVNAVSAVIESKPVIFMQKATKFVPTSVRAKANRKAVVDHKD